jgi:hypothetical protein
LSITLCLPNEEGQVFLWDPAANTLETSRVTAACEAVRALFVPPRWSSEGHPFSALNRLAQHRTMNASIIAVLILLVILVIACIAGRRLLALLAVGAALFAWGGSSPTRRGFAGGVGSPYRVLRRRGLHRDAALP